MLASPRGGGGGAPMRLVLPRCGMQSHRQHTISVSLDVGGRYYCCKCLLKEPSIFAVILGKCFWILWILSSTLASRVEGGTDSCVFLVVLCCRIKCVFEIFQWWLVCLQVIQFCLNEPGLCPVCGLQVLWIHVSQQRGTCKYNSTVKLNVVQ